MRTFFDLAYLNNSPEQKLDLYLPENTEGPYPLIVFFHGGGWEMGDKRDGQHLSWLHLVDHGYALASVNYRMFPEASFPDPVYDCKSALLYLEKNKERFNLDMDKVGTVGDSAGGYFALMLAVMADNSLFPTEVRDIPVKCCVVWYAPTDFYNGKKEILATVMNQIRYGLAIGFIEKYFGKNYEKISDEELIKASPVTYIDLNLPPILIQQGNSDIINPPSQAQLFIEAAKKAGVEEKVTVEIFDRAGHVDPVFDNKSNKDRILDFLNQNLKEKTD